MEMINMFFDSNDVMQMQSALGFNVDVWMSSKGNNFRVGWDDLQIAEGEITKDDFLKWCDSKGIKIEDVVEYDLMNYYIERMREAINVALKTIKN